MRFWGLMSMSVIMTMVVMVMVVMILSSTNACL
jgi:hypothetical protein